MRKGDRSGRFFSRIADSIWNAPKKWFLGTLLILSVLIAGIPQLQFVFDFTRFYTEDSPVTTFFKTFGSEFSGNPQAIWIMPETEEHSFHPRTLLQVAALTDTLKGIEGIERVNSLTNVELPIKDALGLRSERLYRQNIISPFDSTRIMQLPFLRNQLVSEDGRYPGLVVQFYDSIPDERIHETILSIDALLAQRFSKAHISGRYWGEIQYSKMLEEETGKGVLGSVIVLVLMLWILFKRVGSILLPAIAIILGVLAFFGLKGWANWPIDILGVLFPPLLLIVGLSDVVHLYAKIQWKLHLQLPLKKAISEAWKETGYATFLTSLTTGIGFMSLLTTPILPIRNFGWEAGWGVVLMFAVCIVVIPIFLRLAKKPALLPRPATNENWTVLGIRAYRISAHPWKVPLVALLIIITAIAGAFQIESGVENYWQIDKDTRLKEDLDFFDEYFGGARYLDIGVRRIDGEYVDSPDDIRIINELSHFMREHPAIGSVISASDAPSVLNMAEFGGLPTYFALPDGNSRLLNKLDLLYELDSSAYHSFISFSGNWLRISARLQNVKTDSALAIQADIQNKLSELSAEHTLQFTGNSVLMDTTNEMLVGNMFQSLALAFIVIAILMGLLFRSVNMLIISLIPNMLPLLLALSIIGYLDIPLGTSTALILTIGFVIAVDDTIHYLMKFRLRYLDTGSVIESVKETNAQVGRAMTLSSAVMLAAFTPQFFSAFLEQFYFAVVISGVVVSALISDLLLLPWLLLRFFKKE